MLKSLIKALFTINSERTHSIRSADNKIKHTIKESLFDQVTTFAIYADCASSWNRKITGTWWRILEVTKSIKFKYSDNNGVEKTIVLNKGDQLLCYPNP